MKIRHFKYTAENKEGKVVKGKMDAINREICQKFLKTKNYKSIKLREYRNILADISHINIGPLIKQKELVFFLKQLGSLLQSGVNILAALELLALQKDSYNLRILYFELYHDVYNGFAFSNALSKHPKEFPKLLIQMVEIGEMTGDLPNMVYEMADYYDNQIKISSGIKGAIRMPMIYFVAAILIAVGMLMFVFPNITNLFASFGDAELPGITQFFINMGDFVSNYALLFFGAIALFALIFYFLNRYSKSFHEQITKLILRLPIIGNLIKMHNQILIANALNQMLSNGVNPLYALQTIREFLSNVIYKNIIEQTINNIEDGLTFSKAFEESKFIDPIMAKMISTGEKTSDIPRLMKNLSEYYDGVSELRIDQLKNAIQPILLLFVYGIVGVMILAIMLPMISLGGQI